MGEQRAAAMDCIGEIMYFFNVNVLWYEHEGSEYDYQQTVSQREKKSSLNVKCLFVLWISGKW